jgi:predicted glycogen debranching enzyme
MHFSQAKLNKHQFQLNREWLSTSPFGAYASSTLAGCHTRKYHGMFVVPDHLDQMQVLLSSLDETLHADEETFELGNHQYPDLIHPKGFQHLESVDVDELMTWTYRIENVRLQKILLLSKTENRLMVQYRLLESDLPLVHLAINPMMAFRNIHNLRTLEPDFVGKTDLQQMLICTEMDHVPLKLFCQVTGEQEFIHHAHFYYHVRYPQEEERGYAYEEDLYSPGYFKVPLTLGKAVVFTAGLHPLSQDKIQARFKAEIKGAKLLNEPVELLHHAAGQFLRTVRGGKEIQAGFHWFGRWGRDTFIALPGLTLSTHQPAVFASVMKTMLRELKYGLLPNVGRKPEASYNSVDAALWCVWAIQQYAAYTKDAGKCWHEYGPSLKKILNYHAKGTLNGIHAMDNGLIAASETGKALTWMDAIVDGYPVTPRSGMAVDINALWYNAICFCLEAARSAGDTSFIETWSSWPARIEHSFEEVFWMDELGYLADSFYEGVLDMALRPNQLFAVSLPYSPLKKTIKKSVVDAVTKFLLTPRGIRTLEPSDPNYRGVYAGNQRFRDNAYHQGTAWPWLLGHFAYAYAAVNEKKALSMTQKVWDNLTETLTEYCIGSIPEIYDGNEPQHPKGAVSQAWSVAEALRVKDLLDQLKAASQEAELIRSIASSATATVF